MKAIHHKFELIIERNALLNHLSILVSSGQLPLLILTGPIGVGKTEFCQHRDWMQVLDKDELEVVLSNPQAFANIPALEMPANATLALSLPVKYRGIWTVIDEAQSIDPAALFALVSACAKTWKPLILIVQQYEDITLPPQLLPWECRLSRYKLVLNARNYHDSFNMFAWQLLSALIQAVDALGSPRDMRTIQRYVTAIDDLYVDYCLKTLPEQDPHALATLAELENNVNPKTTPRHLQGRPPRVVALEEYFNDHPCHDDVLLGLRSAIQYDKTYFDKIVASLLPLLEKLGTGKTAELISPEHNPSDDRPILDWREVIMKGGVVYVGLDALSDTTVAAAFGNSMFADLCSLAGEIYKFGNSPGMDCHAPPRNIMLHADEFNELIGDEFIPILNKARGAKFVVTAYTQTEADIEARLGSTSKAAQTKGNFNTLCCMRVRDLATAKIMTERMSKVTVYETMPDSGVTDSPGSTVGYTSSNKDSRSGKEIALVNENDITNLPIGQAFAELEGAKIWKLRFPLPSSKGDEMIPEQVQTIIDGMNEKSAAVTDKDAWLQECNQFTRQLDEAKLTLWDEEYASA